MAGPRLLSKRIVNAEVATQTKQKIDQGLTLARKVDAVRETFQTEEANLEKFRSESIRKVQQEIDGKIAERDILERGNVILREDRVRLSAPIDLSEAWNEVNIGKANIAEWKDRLTDQSIQQIAKEAEIDERSKELVKVQKNSKEKDELAERNLTEAETRFTQASDTLERAQREAEKVLEGAREVENRIKFREEEVTQRELYVSKRETEVQEHDVELTGREKKLRMNQEIFIKAQNYIKNKKAI